jgi:3-phosphoshikimate 1-carboxyvinyltransferase
MNVIKSKGLKGTVTIPSDKSISHRAVMFASLANGRSVIKNFSKGQDPLSTLQVCQALGVQAEFKDADLIINSTGKLNAPSAPLYCGNSGTTMRLMAGILAGQNFNSVLTGDESLSKRPMKRIIEPLSQMGAGVNGGADFRAPLQITGTPLHGIDYVSPLASAQVKSAVLLAGLNAQGKTTFTEPYLSRNHTEIMLEYMGAKLSTFHFPLSTITIEPSVLEPKTIEIPGDISSAAYFIAAGLIVPNSEITLKNVGLNPTRTGILDVVEAMGGNVEILDKRAISGEEVGDLRVKTSELKGCTIEGALIARLIDELPVIAMIATQAQGQTVIKDAQDLRAKESDRIKAVVTELKKLGADISETEDGFVINNSPLNGNTELETYHDHRLAMSWYVAGLVCDAPITINGFEWAEVSFPGFENLFVKLFAQ